MTDLRKAAEMALECLNYHWDYFEDESGDGLYVLESKKALRQALSQSVDAVNMSQERVDGTVKREHDLWIAAACLKSTVEAAIKAGDWKVDGACDPTKDLQYLANCLSSTQARKWVGLTDDELEDLEFASVDREYGHLDVRVLSQAIEAKLKEKNV